MSTLKVNKLRDTAGSADAITLDPNGGAVLAGVTTMTTARVTSGIVTNTFIVGAGVTISESGIEASGIGITCASINGTQIGGRRNLVINGAMNIAQRGTSSTSTGYQTVDRFDFDFANTDESPTQAQVDVASGTTPYSLGFRKALKITNGNQTGGAGGGDRIRILHKIEAQDMANSGWNYTSSSSNITLSFWVKASVAQNYYFRVTTSDGTSQNFIMETGSLSADTWTKITKTIPGNSNLTFNNDNGIGLFLVFTQYRGTDNTSSPSLNTWAATGSGNDLYPTFPTTWYTTNDATFELTGVQLEVGPQATAFEHRSFGEELSLCERYFQAHVPLGSSGTYFCSAYNYTSSAAFGVVYHRTRLRTAPTLKQTTGTDYYVFYRNGSGDYFDSFESFQWSNGMTGNFRITSGISGTAGHAGAFYTSNSSAYVAFDSEL